MSKLHIFHGKDDPGLDLPDGCILSAYRGSIAHGMYLPEDDPKSVDDVDVMSFHVGSPECYLGLEEWGSRGTREIKQGKYDVVCYEIRKAVRLLLQGNPNIFSILWLDKEHYLNIEPEGRYLLENRNAFVGKHLYKPFAGYAAAQLERMDSIPKATLISYLKVTAELKSRGIHPNHKGEKIAATEPTNLGHATDGELLFALKEFHGRNSNLGYLGDKRKRLILEHGYDAKNAAHLIRLLRMAEEFMRWGELAVNRRGRDSSELLSIKCGDWSSQDVKDLAETLFRRVKQARDASKLPEKPDYDRAQGVLMDIVSNQIRARIGVSGSTSGCGPEGAGSTPASGTTPEVAT